MNSIEKLRSELSSRFPDVSVKLDPPADESGLWQLDVRPSSGPWVVVEWKADRGFGVSTPGGDDYGLKPDELYPNAKAACDRVVRLILSGGRTEPPAAVRLGEIRQAHGLSQSQVAERAGIKQAAVARIEGRDDILLSTLNRLVTAMGGTVSIQVHFPGEETRELTGLVSPLPGTTEVPQIAPRRELPAVRTPPDGKGVGTTEREKGSQTFPAHARQAAETVVPVPGVVKGRSGTTRKTVGKGEKPRK
jgi:transcriptional regulator with XRE-family HTH domain